MRKPKRRQGFIKTRGDWLLIEKSRERLISYWRKRRAVDWSLRKAEDDWQVIGKRRRQLVGQWEKQMTIDWLLRKASIKWFDTNDWISFYYHHRYSEILCIAYHWPGLRLQLRIIRGKQKSNLLIQSENCFTIMIIVLYVYIQLINKMRKGFSPDPMTLMMSASGSQKSISISWIHCVLSITSSGSILYSRFAVSMYQIFGTLSFQIHSIK